MKKSTNELTIEYINENPYIKNCLKNGLINYSALSRMIAKDLKIEKNTSIEAILISARRYQEKLQQELTYEQKISTLLKRSELEIKNKMCVLIIKKENNITQLFEIQKKAKESFSNFFIIEGSDSYTIIISEKFLEEIESKFNLIKVNKNLVLLNIKSPKEIENIPGVVSYLTGLFSQNEVNIYEFLSSWTDTMFVISSKDLNKAINFLEFR